MTYDATKGGGRLRTGRNIDILTEEDIADILEEFPFETTPEDLKRVLTDAQASLIYTGRQWGWDDTVARDELAALLGVES